MLTVYYLVATFVCFCAYREFKAMLFDHGMGQGFGMPGMGQHAQRQAPPQQQQQQPGGGGGGYQGNGTRIGGGMSVNGGQQA